MSELQSSEDLNVCFHVDPGWREATVLQVMVLGFTQCERVEREQDLCHSVCSDLALEVTLLSFMQYSIAYKSRIYLVYKGMT